MKDIGIKIKRLQKNDYVSGFILPFRETPRPQLANSDMELPLEDKQQSQQ